MRKRKLTKTLATVICTAFLGSVISACGSSGTGSNEQSSETEQKIVYNLGADPKTIDPQLSSAIDGSTIIVNNFEGLMRLDENSKPKPAAADKYEASDDGLVYKFYMREDAKWSDGQSVKAQDFEYAWKRALNPEVAAEYAYQLFYLKNAESYYKGKSKIEDIGVKALDDKTLEVTLEAPVPYFLSLTSFPTYYPVRKDIIEEKGDKWTLSPESYIGNGPFKMSEWKEKESMTFVKNKNYWDSNNVKLEKLVIKLIDDEVTYLNSFNSGEIDIIEQPPTTEIPSLLAEGKAKVYPYLGTYFYVINVSDNATNVDKEAGKVIQDPKVRKALALSIDKKLIVEQVAQGGQEPAKSYVPKGIVSTDGKEFQKDYFTATADLENAKKLLAEAGYPNGKGFPKISITFNTGSGHQMIAQAIQDMWKKNLGIEVELKNEEWAVFQDTRNTFNYLVARHGWIADYNDPMTFLDMWVTGNGQNNAGYSNKEYDEVINKAKKELDPTKRTELLHKAEDILMEDMPIIPIYYYTNVVCADPKVKGVIKSPLGQTEFKGAYVEK